MKKTFLMIVSLWLTLSLQAQVSMTADVTAGTLSTALSATELRTITNLTLTGTIDTRDFKTMSCYMPSLKNIDLSGTTISAYSGTEGTNYKDQDYPANNVPDYAFSTANLTGSTSLISIKLPSMVTSVGYAAFYKCAALNSITLPSTISYIGFMAFGGCTSLLSVDLPSSLTYIGEGAFSGCSELTSITIPSSVTTIERIAFSGCTSLNSISIPSSVTFIGDVAFAGSAALIYVDEGNQVYSSADGILFDKAQTKLFYFPTSKTGSYTIPSSVNSISDGVFASCKGITEILIPSSVTYIGSVAFQDCIGLTSISLPASVSSIGFSAFSGCTGLTSIHIESLTPVDLSSEYTQNVFLSVDLEKCTLFVPYNTKSLYTEAAQWKDFTHIVEMPGFYPTPLQVVIGKDGGSTEIQVAANVNWTANTEQSWLVLNPNSGTGNSAITATAGPNAFIGLRIGKITLSAPDVVSQSIYVIQEGSPHAINISAGSLASAFAPYEFSLIYDLTLTGTIDARDFKTMRDKMPLLASVNLNGATIAAYTGIEGTSPYPYTETYPANAIPSFAFVKRTLGNGVFSEAINTVLKSVVLPSSVTEIGLFAFDNCTGLTSFSIPSSVATIKMDAFLYCKSLTSLTIPASVTYIGLGAFEEVACPITVDANNNSYSSSDGVLFDKIQSTLIQSPTSKIGSYTIPSSVTTIATGAFFDCTNLTLINILSSVKVIDVQAFAECKGLTSVTIPSSVTSIGNEAFRNCRKLKSIYALNATPLDLTSSIGVFIQVEIDTCILYVPFGSKITYQNVNQWKDFKHIVEMPEFKLSTVSLNVPSAGGTANADLTTGQAWTAVSDQSWLTLSSTAGTGNKAFTFTAVTNPTFAPRFATVTVSATDMPSQTIVITQAAAVKTVNTTAGSLASVIPAGELSSISSLAIAGTIDARDFRTMRDKMPYLTELNLSSASIAAYTGTGGTATSFISGRSYPANAIPLYAFFNPISYLAKTNLSSIIFPSGTTTVELGAFLYCNGLKTINIPSSVTSIEDQAFELSSGYITVDPNNSKYSSQDGMLYDKLKTALIYCPTSIYGNIFIPSSVTTLKRYAFGDCTGLTAITIPSSVTSIATEAFYNCKSLGSLISFNPTPVNLSSSLGVFDLVDKSTCILKVPFGSLENYKTASQWKDFLNIEEMPVFNLSPASILISAAGGTGSVQITTNTSWTAVSDQAWLTVNTPAGSGNNTITFTAIANPLIGKRFTVVYVTIPGGISQIIQIIQPEAPFNVNTTAGGLSSALTANELNTIARLAITGTIDARDFKTMRDLMPLLTEADLSGTTIVAYTGTLGTYNTNSTTYPANSTPRNAFYYSTTYKGKISLTSVILPNSLTSIGSSTFDGCSGLTSFIIPSMVTSIESSAFSSCTGLNSVTIPSSVSSIGFSAFSGCTGLTNCTIPSSVTLIDAYAFYNCTGLSLISIPSSVTNIQYEAFSGCGYINVDSGNPNYSSVAGILFNKNKTTLMHFPFMLTGVYNIPSNVTRLGQGSFKNCTNLTSIVIPSSVTSIESLVFYNCNALQSIYVKSATPVNLSSSSNVFGYVGLATCKLYVSAGSKSAYQSANQWKDFTNILEIPELNISASTATISATTGSTATIDITSNISWAASSDQSWLTGSPASGNGNGIITFTAESNPTNSSRTAIITISGEGVDSKVITIKQNGIQVIQSIPLNTGWNIISANVIPDSLDMKAIFQPLIDGGQLKKVMDEAGKTIENFGAFGGWKNNIGNLNSSKGYKVNVSEAVTLSLEGVPIPLPADISMLAGWNIISYPCPTGQDAKALVQPLIDSGQLKKVMDEAGKTIENFGAFGGWKNNIGNFLTGRGYKVNVTANCTLTITASANKSAIIVPEVLASAHFSKVFTGNGTDHFNVHLVDLASSGLKAGDQIGIFDGNYCVGSATIGQDQLLGGSISIPASCNDELFGKVNGFTVGHPVTLQLYRNNQTYPLSPAKVGGSEAFEKNGSLFLKVTASDLPTAKISAGSDQMSCYPNPFVDQLTIQIRLTEPKKLEVSIYDLSGKLVRRLFKGDAGTSETLFWDGTNGNGAKMGSGTYILKANEMVEKVALKK